jgi:hypothetical protein
VKALDFVQFEMDSFMLVWRVVFRFVSKCKWVRIDQDPGFDLQRIPSDLTREDVHFQVWSSVLIFPVVDMMASCWDVEDGRTELLSLAGCDNVLSYPEAFQRGSHLVAFKGL